MNRRFANVSMSTAAVCAIAWGAGCKHTIAVEPIEVKPIHMTLDINLKVDRELDKFFDYEDEPSTTAPAGTQPVAPAPAPAPASAPAPEPATNASNGGQS